MSARVEVRDGMIPVALPRKYRVRRWVAAVVVAAVALVGSSVVLALSSDASTPVVPQSPVSYVAAALPTTETPVAPRRCAEDDPCWNSCTMGNMSPCDGTAALPYGARFRVGVTYNPLDRSCGQGWALAQVTVYVYGADGGLLAESGTAYGCAPGGDAFAENGVGSMLPELFRWAASAL